MQIDYRYGHQSLTKKQNQMVAFAGRGHKGKEHPIQPVDEADVFQGRIAANGRSRKMVEGPESPISPVEPRGANGLWPPAKDLPGDGDELIQRLEEVSPVLAKWFRPPHYKPGGRVEFLSLPDALIKGIEASGRVSPPRKKPGRPLSGAASPNMEAFLPGASTLDFDRAQVVQVLQKARQQLQQVLEFDSENDPVATSQLSRQLLRRFLDEPGRSDFSAAAFLENLCHQDFASDTHLQVPVLVPETQAVVSELRSALEAQRRLALDPFEKECPALSRFSLNLTLRAKEGQLTEALMRDEAIERMLALMHSDEPHSTHLMLQAPNGVGKTSVLLGLAQRLARQKFTEASEGTHVLQLDVPALKAAEGSHQGKVVEDALSQLHRYLQEHPRQKVVLVIDDAHLLLEADDSQNLPLLLKRAGLLECQNLSLVGAMTPNQWNQVSQAADQSFWGQFQPMVLPVFSDVRQLGLLSRSALQLEKHHGVIIPPDILEKALALSRTVWPQGTLEGAKALLKGAVAELAQGTALRLAALNDELQEQELFVHSLEGQGRQRLPGHYQRQLQAARLKLNRLKREIDALHSQAQSANASRDEKPILQERHLQQAFTTMTGSTPAVLSADDLTKLQNVEAIMGRYIVGQPEALRGIAQGLREIAIRHKTGLMRDRPIVSMLLPGPTGVGKTEAARVIAKEFMNGHLIRLDMSDYMEKHAASLLTGAPPGYVGYEQGGLVDQVRRYPKSVVVFDEIEKAHPDVFNLLLQILGEGELRNNRGETVSFRDTVVILTSNLNQEALTELVARHRHSPKAQKDPALAASDLEKQVRMLLTADANNGGTGFKPEQLGRIDYVIPFNPLTTDNVGEILDIQLQNLNRQAFLRAQNLEVSLSQSVRERLKAFSVGHIDQSTLDAGLNERGSHFKSSIRKVLKVFCLGGDNHDSVRPIPGGARSIATQFERHIAQRVINELAVNPAWSDLENTRIAVDYDPQRQSFVLRLLPQAPSTNLTSISATTV